VLWHNSSFLTNNWDSIKFRWDHQVSSWIQQKA
jgi:hypothetical protein